MTSDKTPARFHSKQIEMAHGAGGEASRRLIEGLFAPILLDSNLAALTDSAIIESPDEPIALTTDSFVVHPLQFPGGSIGSLAVNGTVNDLAVSGARPLALTASFILEAGLDTSILEREVRAMADAADRAEVKIVAGDTKVVEHGKADGMYITTSGVGRLHKRSNLDVEHVQAGDAVVLSGPIADHGITILLARNTLELEADIRSDSRPLSSLTLPLIEKFGPGIRWMRDATRGGVATVLNELSRDTQLTVELLEEQIPVNDPVRGACELLGLDPLSVANEGQFVAVVAADCSEQVVAALNALPGGTAARAVGQIRSDRRPKVIAKSAYGGARVIDMLIGDPLPRIC